MKNKLNIFIAGSKALEKERNLFKIVAQDLQLDYANHKKKNIHISVTTFESFSSIFTSKETLQDVYNKYIREESDVVFFVFDGTIGGITKDEFEVAESAYKDSKNNKPKLCVFTKENTEINLEIENLKQRVNDIGQYWVDYANEDELRRKIYIELSRQVDELVFKKPWYKRILPYFIVAVLLSSIMVFSKLLQKPIEPVYSYDIQVIDELLTNGRLIVNKDSTDVIKYRISTEDTPVVNWNDKSIPYLTSRDTIYPKENCIIKVYGQSAENDKMSCEKSYNFDFCSFVETVVRSKNAPIAVQLFSSSYLEINFDDGVCDIVRRNPINTLYDYLKEYGYTITSVQTEEYGLDVFSKEYPTIISVTLAKE